MNTQTQEALKLALEALQYLCKPLSHGWDAETQKEKRDQAIISIREALAEQPAQQQKEGFASPGGGYVPAIPRPIPLDWKLVPRKATPEMLRAMDECAQEGYDERLYEGMASSVYMAAWDASPVLGTLPPSEKERSMMDIIVGNLVREGINKHRARELAEHFVKQCNYTNGYCTGRIDLLAEQKAQQRINCKSKRDNNGVCPHHNLQCGWPKCNESEQPAQQKPVPDALHFAQWTAAKKDLSDYILVGSLSLAGIEDGEYGTSEIDPLDNTIEALQEKLVTGSDHKKVPLLAYIGAWNNTSPQPSKPLTDEQIGMAFRKAFPVGSVVFTNGAIDFARAIEAAHQIGVKK